MSKNQGSNAVNAIVKAKIGEDMLASVQRGLESVGVEGDGVKLALATAIAVGMEPSRLIDPKNLQALKQASDAMRVYGLLPSRHFYMMPFGQEADRVYSFVLSIDYLDYCVRRWAMEMGMGILPESRPIMNPDEARLYLDMWAHANWIDHPQNRVALARYVPVVGGVRQIGVSEGWESASVGYFLYKGYLATGKNGTTYETGGSEHMVRGRTVNRAPINIAITRAQRAAARAITRTLYPVGTLDDRRMLELAAIAERNAPANMDDVVAAGQESTEAQLSDGRDADVEDGEFTDVPQEETAKPVEEKPIVVQEEKPKAKKTKKEAPAPAPEPEKIEMEDDDVAGGSGGEQKSVEESWRDITSAIRASLPDDTKAWCNGLIATENLSGKPVTPKNLVNLRSWCGAFAGVSADSQLDEGVTMGDAILAVLFNVPIAEVPAVDNRAFIRLADAAGTKDGNSLVQDPKSEGARHIKVVAAELKNYEASEWTS